MVKIADLSLLLPPSRDAIPCRQWTTADFTEVSGSPGRDPGREGGSTGVFSSLLVIGHPCQGDSRTTQATDTIKGSSETPYRLVVTTGGYLWIPTMTEYSRPRLREVNILLRDIEPSWLTTVQYTMGLKVQTIVIYSFTNQTKDYKNKFRGPLQTAAQPMWTSRLLKQNWGFTV